MFKVWTLTTAATTGKLVEGPAERPDQEARETLGTALVPDLVSGKYEFAYRDACWNAERNRTVRCEPNYFAWRLEGYTGPPAQRGPLPLRVVDHEKWQFVHYVPPVFPPIALSARVFGDVHLRLEVDSVSGAVTRATVAKSIALLDAAALAAAGKWRFVPGSTPGGPFDVAIQFRVECRGQCATSADARVPRRRLRIHRQSHPLGTGSRDEPQSLNPSQPLVQLVPTGENLGRLPIVGRTSPRNLPSGHRIAV